MEQWREYRKAENTVILGTSLLTFLLSYIRLNEFGYDTPGSVATSIAMGTVTFLTSQGVGLILNRNLCHKIKAEQERHHQQISFQLANQLPFVRDEQLEIPSEHLNYLKKRLKGERGFGLLAMLPEEGIRADELREELRLRYDNGRERPIDHDDVLDYLEDLESYHLTEKRIEGPVSIDTPIVFQYKPTRLGSLVLNRFNSTRSKEDFQAF